jgi:trans-4-hydroxy-L-proline dehydratase
MATTETPTKQRHYHVKQPTNLSPRIQWLRDYYFKGVKRSWNNEATAWTTGTPWDFQYNEVSFYIVPETYSFL